MRRIVFGFLFATIGVCPRGSWAQETGDVIESFAIEGNRGLLVPVEVDGKEYQFALDTGATGSVFDIALKSSLKARGTQISLNDGPLIELYECPTATVGRTKLKAGRWVICNDLSGFRRLTGSGESGILGMEFLGQHIVQIDFDGGKVSFLKRGASVDGQRIPLQFNKKQCPTIDLELPTVGKKQFLIDTGCVGFRSGFLSKSVFNELVRAKRLQLFNGTHLDYGIGGPVRTRTGAVEWQLLQGLRHGMQIYTENDSDCDGNGLGLGYLSRYKVTFDFRNRVMFLEKGKGFDRNFPPNRAGVDFATSEEGPVVSAVDENGPAWKSGIRSGDRIGSIGGKDASQLSPLQVGLMLDSSRLDLPLTVVAPHETRPRNVRIPRYRPAPTEQ